MQGRIWKQLAIATHWPVLASVAVLSAVGIISIWADSPEDGRKQLQYLLVGVLCMAVFQAVNYKVLARWVWGFYVFSLLLILYTVAGSKISLPGVHNIKGTYAWINFGAMSLQPAELMKIAFIGALAEYLRYRSNYRTVKGLIPPFLLALIPLMAILKQPDLGTALVFIPTLFAMLFAAGAKVRHLLAVVGMGVAVAPILWLSGPTSDGAPGVPVLRHLPAFVKPYQRARVYAMFSQDPQVLQETGYQQMLALTALGSGGPSGKGMMNIPVGQHVPESHNDMVFALIGEQFGFVGVLAVLVAYIILFAAGIEIAGATREPFGRLTAVGVVSVLAGQTFLNLMVCVKLMPVTGITLPFVSYGGSSLLASFMAVGLLLNIGQNRPAVIAPDAFEF